ncbi:MAG: glycosyltransferase, partial [Ruminococcaceae bacterium]|nr:glycosyltransferase [Oscillospiraceae bacterium]
MKLKTAFVGTDYTCSPGTARSELDYYFIPAESLKEEFIEQGVAAQKIVVSGIPVRKEFYTQGDKAKAKRKLGIDPHHTHLLMMCGSMGCGPLRKLTELLSVGMDESMELSIICGTNEKLYKELSAEYAGWSNIHIHGFQKDISLFMDSADLYLTKPGGLSTTEAAVKNLPMVFIDAVAGCEEYNLNYFVFLGGAATADSTEDLARLCLDLLKDKAGLSQMEKALQKLPHANAAQQICRTMQGNE